MIRQALWLVGAFSLASAGCVGGEDGAIDVAPDAGLAQSPDAAPVPDAHDIAFDAALPPAADASVPTDDLPVELACTLEDVQPILSCVSENCLESVSDGTLLTCVTLSCGLLLLTTPPECSQCILAGISDASTALDSCVLGLDDLGGGGLPTP